MTVLVTGVTGFTGGHLARRLLGSGDRVRVLARNPERIPDDLRRRVDVVQGDLTSTRDLERAVAGCEVVYNIAALYREAGLPADTYRTVNALAVVTLIEAAAAAGVRRVVHCSTVGVHGDIHHPPADEDAPLAPGDIYQETKVEGEQLARAAAQRSGIELVIARPTGIYGPGDRRLFKMFGQIARGRFVMLGTGRNFYHLTYVDDLCDGFRLCGTVAAAAGRTYILGGGEVTTLAEVVRITGEVARRTRGPLRLPVWPVWLAGALCEMICAPLGISPPIYRRRVDFFRKSRSFDISRARRELGYAPRVGVREGITRTLEWYREHGWI
jgi:nucleoside-diphosphate-sugar epimerase